MRQQLITLLLGEASQEVRGDLFPPPPGKSKPAYSQEGVPPQLVIGEESVTVDSRQVTFRVRGYRPDVLLIESRLDVPTLFDRCIFALEEQVYTRAYRMLESRGGRRQLSEEYSIFAVSDYAGPPEQFLEHAPLMTSLLKSEGLDLDPKEVEHTLEAQIKYGMNDLAIIDWDGAFLFDSEGDFEEDIELLVLANLQLLRHRILDRQLDAHLSRLNDLVTRSASGRTFRRRELAADLRTIIRLRGSSISALQRLDRSVRLIGDWYSARLFGLAATKFRLDGWRASIRSRLDALEDTYTMVAENFSVSAQHRVEWYQIIAFFILQVGWFLLIILEFWYFTHH